MSLFSLAKRRLRRARLRQGRIGPLAAKLVREARSRGPRDAQHTLFALKPERFRGDLDILADQFGFRILSFKKGWQQKLLELYWDEGFQPEHDYYHPPANSDQAAWQRDIRAMLKKLLPEVFRRAGVDCVLAAATYYLDDWDYLNALDEIGFPLVVIYRECLQASQKNIEFQATLCSMLGSFKGSRLLVHNEVTRKAMIDCGFVAPDKIAAPGCMRMDPFIKAIKAKRAPRERKRATLFSFVHCSGVPHLCNDFTKERKLGFVELFDRVHTSFVRLALAHPDVDFVIKPKWGGPWIDEINVPVKRDLGVDVDRVPNLSILPDADAQQVILGSDVVVGFGSTVLLEAGVAGVPVIIPHFAEADREDYVEYVLLRDDYDAFDVARSPGELEQLILERLADPTVPEEVLTQRREVFERYVSPLSGDAAEQYARLITRIIQEDRTDSA